MANSFQRAIRGDTGNTHSTALSGDIAQLLARIERLETGAKSPTEVYEKSLHGHERMAAAFNKENGEINHDLKLRTFSSENKGVMQEGLRGLARMSAAFRRENEQRGIKNP